MSISRRQFLKVLTAAGVSVSSAGWLVDRVAALEAEGALQTAPGPGIESWVTTTCGFCPGGCGLEARLIDGLPVGVRGRSSHLVNAGKLCPAAHATIQMLYNPDRVRTPLKRIGRRRHPEWEAISWESAEKLMVKHLGEAMSGGEAQRIAFLDGRRRGAGTEIARAFMRGAGSSNYIHIEDSAQEAIARESFGWPRSAGVDLESALVVALFAFDAFGTEGSPVWQSRVYAAGRDRTIDRPIYLSIGPRLLGSAAKCDHWLPARPGSEGLIALAMAHHILETGQEDPVYLERYTDWFDESSSSLRDLVTEMTPAVVSDISGVPAEQIEAAAEMFAKHRPGVAVAGCGSPSGQPAAMTAVAVNVLNLLVASVGSRGGVVARNGAGLAPAWEAGESQPSLPAASLRSPAQLAKALDAAHPDHVDVLFLRDARPAFEGSLATPFSAALAATEAFVVAFTSEMDETSQLADLILPEPTFAERWDLLTDTPIVPRRHASLQQPLLEPMFESRQSEAVLAGIAEHLADSFSLRFKSTKPDKLVAAAAAGLHAQTDGGICSIGGEGKDTSRPASARSFWKELRSDGVWALDADKVLGDLRQRRIVTLPRTALGLGKGEITERLRVLITPSSTRDANLYPYYLVTFQIPELRNGELANYPFMMELSGQRGSENRDTWAELNPRTAAELGVSDGNTILVASDVGGIEVTAHLTEGVPPGIVAVPLGLGHKVGAMASGIGANANTIVEAQAADDGVTVTVLTRVKVQAL